MTAGSSFISTVAERYARSLYDLADTISAVHAIELEYNSFSNLVDQNRDLKRLIYSPLFTAYQQLQAITALGEQLNFKGNTAKGLFGRFLKVLAFHHRLNLLDEVLIHFKRLSMQARGELEAEVVVAKALTAKEEKELTATLKTAAGKDIRLKTVVDPVILGGLIVRLGSRQIDTTLATKLSSLKLALKEVG